MKKVLILGNNERAGLTVARSLGRKGIIVDIANMGVSSVASSSRYVRKTSDLGDPRLGVDRFFHRLDDILSKGSYSMVLPINDRACQVCMAFRDRLEEITKLPLPPQESFQYAHNKLKLLELASRLGIETVNYSVISSYDDIANYRAKPNLFPCYLKPIHSAVINDNELITFRVKKVDRWGDFEDFVRFTVDNVAVMVQEICPGHGVGIYVLAKQGEILSMIQQNRLHEPETGGGSSYRISVPIDPMLKSQAEALVAAINWTGVAMIEFKGSAESGRWRLMEINGRFWGSLALTVSAGLDFPYLLFKMTTEVSAPIVCASEGKTNIRQRHLMKDIKWLMTELRRCPNRLSLFLHWIGEFRYVFQGKEFYDVESLVDPLPALALPTFYVGNFLTRLQSWTARKVLELSYRRSYEAKARSLLTLVTDDTPNILFVCRGNICRSPFAEYYCQQKLAYPHVRSAGTLSHSRRMSSTTAAEVAQKHFGLEFDKHRSKGLTPHLLSWAHIIIVMDFKNLQQLQDMDTANKPIFILSSQQRLREVSDPFLRGEATYLAVYSRIRDELVRIFHRDKIHLAS